MKEQTTESMEWNDIKMMQAESLAAANELLSLLEKKIAPILREPEPKTEGVRESIIGYTELELHMLCVSQKLSDIRNRIGDIITRVSPF